MSEGRLLSDASIGAIADLARSTPDVERVLGDAGITLEVLPPVRDRGAVIVPNVRQRLVRTLKALDLADRSTVNSVLAAAAKLSEIYQNAPNATPGRLARLRDCLAADGYHVDKAGDPMAAIRSLADTAGRVLADASAIRAELTRLERNLGADPSQDIGAAKRLIESTAKIIIVRTGGTVPRNAKVPDLIDRALTSVDTWSTSKHRNIQEILGSLKQAAIGVNRLRNNAGDGHGGVTAVTGIDDRDSRLAVRVAIAWCAYVLDCFGDLPAHSSAD
ncbi:Abortive infection C-terminus [Actinomadura meyerae]|uniref:Abortive infection C-terminus n=1 Tax=Actinomadura meyerae TaxID=240840 RepID=A0A239EI56_9ACTN|nr:abortive infection family protein [Actinomadura meyerae]SNS44307.1 Abortive infection C-terminus [Actinomadura meyerae]